MYTYMCICVCVHMYTYRKYVLCIWKVEANHQKGQVSGQAM